MYYVLNLGEISLDHVRMRQMSVCILCTECKQPRLILGTADYYIILISEYGNFYAYQFFLCILECQTFKHFSTGSVIPRLTSWTHILLLWNFLRMACGC
jgi:hypothetical protein